MPNDALLINESYGVIPYAAPEIFKGAAFSKETDIYSFGWLCGNLQTGCKPFANVGSILFIKLLMEYDPKLQMLLLNVLLN